MSRRTADMTGNRFAIVVGCLLASSFFACATTFAADSEDERFLEGLRTRRLFSLAEMHCQQRLTDETLTAVDRAELTNQLIRTYALHAINSPPQDRDALWQKAHQAAAEFAAQHRDNPRAFIVRFQNALTYLAHGQLLRQEWEIGAGGDNVRDSAIEQTGKAARELDELDKELTREIPLRDNPRGDEYTAAELLSLQNKVRHQITRAYRNQAMCFDKESVDRLDALSRVTERQDELLRRLPETDPLRAEVIVERIVCQRLLGNLNEASELLTRLEASRPAVEIQLQLRAEAVRLELDRGRPQVAVDILAKGGAIAGQASPELDFAQLETIEALARAAAEKQDDDEVAEWQAKADAMAQAIEQTHGPYWGRRANLFLVRSFSKGGGTKNLDILIRVADESFIKGQYDDAVKAYEQAAMQAKTARNTEQTFALLYKAALVEHQRRRHVEAAVRLQGLALDMKTHDQAPRAHLLAAWNLSQLASEDAKATAQYVSLLEEHIATWPASPSADTARIWLGRIREYERAWVEAIDLNLEVSQSSAQFTEAVGAAARCARNYFEELKTTGEPYGKQAELMAQRFEDLILGADGKPPARWSAAQQDAVVIAARIRLQHTSSGHASAADFLRAALDGSSDAESAWKTTVNSLLVVALAGQESRRAEARDILQRAAESQPDELLDMIGGLTALGHAASPSAKREIARLQLDALDLLAPKRDQLSAINQLWLDRLRAESLAASGRRNEATQLYEQLAKDNPKDALTQVSYAQFLSAGEDRQSLEKALERWRIIAARSRSSSERWYEAKYHVALAQFKLGQKDDAGKLLRYLKETPPGWDTSDLRDQFESLLRRCE